MTIPVLKALLAAYERREAQTAYLAQVTWQACSLLAAWAGSSPMPDYFTFFPLRDERLSAEDIRSRISRRLARLDPQRKEE